MYLEYINDVSVSRKAPGGLDWKLIDKGFRSSNNRAEFLKGSNKVAINDCRL